MTFQRIVFLILFFPYSRTLSITDKTSSMEEVSFCIYSHKKITAMFLNFICSKHLIIFQTFFPQLRFFCLILFNGIQKIAGSKHISGIIRIFRAGPSFALIEWHTVWLFAISGVLFNIPISSMQISSDSVSEKSSF